MRSIEALRLAVPGLTDETAQEALDMLNALGVLVVQTQPHARVIHFAEDLLDNFGLRNASGWAIKGEWGEPHEDGTYEPAFTAEYDGYITIHTEDAPPEAVQRVVAEITRSFEELPDGEGVN